MASKHQKMNRFFVIFVFSFCIISCKQENKEYYKKTGESEIYHTSLKKLTDVIVHDIFSPPVASRIYAYASIGGYEAARLSDTSFATWGSRIKHFPTIAHLEENKEYCYEMVATLTMLKIGKNLIFSEDSINLQIKKVLDFYQQSGMPKNIFNRSNVFSDSMVASVMKWASKDNYLQTRTYPKYSVTKDVSAWKPTPPGYMDGIEPSWNKIRPFLLDSAAQFKPAPPTAFNVKDKNSAYYLETMEVYDAVKNSTEEEKEIANFWDCNPYKLNVMGHVMHATKKISPGGHWINIVGLACKKANTTFLKTTEAYAMTSIALADAFISCWDEKYRSVAIRPETVINEYIDPDWLPLLQTPPFPEYTSGHSVASGAASEVLTHLFGDNFSFTDDTEVEFGLPTRSFTSFYHAASEACISRFYGGIHFMPAIVDGEIQGKSVGKMVVGKE